MPATFEELGTGSVFAGRAGDNKKLSTLYEIAEAGLKPSMTCRVVNGKIYNTKDTDLAFSGILECERGHDPDVAYEIGDKVHIYEAGDGQNLWIPFKAAAGPVPLNEGDDVYLSDTDGLVKSGVGHYADGAEATDFPTTRVGKVVKYDPGHATETHLVKVKV